MPVSTAFTVELDTYTAGSTLVQTPTTSWTGTGAWQRVTQTVTLGATETQIWPYVYTTQSVTFYIDAAQLEQGAAANTFNSCIGLTSANISFPFTVLGTAPYQQPIITVTFTAIGSSPVTGTVSIGNNATGQQLNITRLWTAADVLIIDSSLSSTTPVTVNGSAVNFVGAFPAFFSSFAGTAGTLTYADTFASRTITLAALYYKNYL